MSQSPALFYLADAPVPAGLRTEEFVLRVLRAADAALDYDAVISSREQLLVKSGGDWPREGFTLEENLADLERHERDFHERSGFTYTVMNPTETECLGCVYIYPLRSLLERVNASQERLARVGDYEARVWFWTRSSRLADHLDARLLEALRGWLRREWAFARVVFSVNANETEHLRLLQQAGLREQETLQGERSTLYLYG
ncbi:MAG TPA: hypothetical protein VH540_10925 [Ktedonobacterales bacterium]|jgi:hypothetical protein